MKNILYMTEILEARDDRYAQSYLSGLALAAIMIAWI